MSGLEDEDWLPEQICQVSADPGHPFSFGGKQSYAYPVINPLTVPYVLNPLSVPKPFLDPGFKLDAHLLLLVLVGWYSNLLLLDVRLLLNALLYNKALFLLWLPVLCILLSSRSEDDTNLDFQSLESVPQASLSIDVGVLCHVDEEHVYTPVPFAASNPMPVADFEVALAALVDESEELTDTPADVAMEKAAVVEVTVEAELTVKKKTAETSQADDERDMVDTLMVRDLETESVPIESVEINVANVLVDPAPPSTVIEAERTEEPHTESKVSRRPSSTMDCEPEEGAEYHAVVAEAPLYIEHYHRSISVVIEEESTEPPVAVVEAPSRHRRSTTRSCGLNCEPVVDVADTMITEEFSVEAAQPKRRRRSSGFCQ